MTVIDPAFDFRAEETEYEDQGLDGEHWVVDEDILSTDDLPGHGEER